MPVNFLLPTAAEQAVVPDDQAARVHISLDEKTAKAHAAAMIKPSGKNDASGITTRLEELEKDNTNSKAYGFVKSDEDTSSIFAGAQRVEMSDKGVSNWSEIIRTVSNDLNETIAKKGKARGAYLLADESGVNVFKTLIAFTQAEAASGDEDNLKKVQDKAKSLIRTALNGSFQGNYNSELYASSGKIVEFLTANDDKAAIEAAFHLIRTHGVEEFTSANSKVMRQVARLMGSDKVGKVVVDAISNKINDLFSKPLDPKMKEVLETQTLTAEYKALQAHTFDQVKGKIDEAIEKLSASTKEIITNNSDYRKAIDDRIDAMRALYLAGNDDETKDSTEKLINSVNAFEGKLRNLQEDIKTAVSVKTRLQTAKTRKKVDFIQIPAEMLSPALKVEWMKAEYNNAKALLATQKHTVTRDQAVANLADQLKDKEGATEIRIGNEQYSVDAIIAATRAPGDKTLGADPNKKSYNEIVIQIQDDLQAASDKAITEKNKNAKALITQVEAIAASTKVVTAVAATGLTAVNFTAITKAVTTDPTKLNPLFVAATEGTSATPAGPLADRQWTFRYEGSSSDDVVDLIKTHIDSIKTAKSKEESNLKRVVVAVNTSVLKPIMKNCKSISAKIATSVLAQGVDLESGEVKPEFAEVLKNLADTDIKAAKRALESECGVEVEAAYKQEYLDGVKTAYKKVLGTDIENAENWLASVATKATSITYANKIADIKNLAAAVKGAGGRGLGEADLTTLNTSLDSLSPIDKAIKQHEQLRIVYKYLLDLKKSTYASHATGQNVALTKVDEQSLKSLNSEYATVTNHFDGKLKSIEAKKEAVEKINDGDITKLPDSLKDSVMKGFSDILRKLFQALGVTATSVKDVKAKLDKAYTGEGKTPGEGDETLVKDTITDVIDGLGTVETAAKAAEKKAE